MKIYFQNKAAKLNFSSLFATCKRCPFNKVGICPFGTPTTINCYGKGWWVDGELPDIFKI